MHSSAQGINSFAALERSLRDGLADCTKATLTMVLACLLDESRPRSYLDSGHGMEHNNASLE